MFYGLIASTAADNVDTLEVVAVSAQLLIGAQTEGIVFAGAHNVPVRIVDAAGETQFWIGPDGKIE